MADVQQLIQQLVNPATRQQAYTALVALGADAVDPLIAAFESASPDFGQHQVALVLKAIGDPRAVPALINWAQNAPPKARESAVIALGSFGADARVPDALRDIARHDSEPRVRLVAVSAIGAAVSKEAEKQVWLDLLNDPVEQVAMNAVSNLPGKFKGDPTIVEPLIAALNKSGQSDAIQGWIINALGQIGDARAFDSIVPHLQSPNAHRRASAANVLGKLGDPRAIDLLIPLKSDKAVAWEEDHGGPKYTVGDIAKQALAQLGQKPPVDGNKGETKKPFWKIW